jgi:hypothetical protein
MLSRFPSHAEKIHFPLARPLGGEALSVVEISGKNQPLIIDTNKHPPVGSHSIANVSRRAGCLTSSVRPFLVETSSDKYGSFNGVFR